MLVYQASQHFRIASGPPLSFNSLIILKIKEDNKRCLFLLLMAIIKKKDWSEFYEKSVIGCRLYRRFCGR